MVRSVMIRALLATVAVSIAVDAADIRLTLQDNVTVVLHGDQTWSCADAAKRRQLADMTIRLEDGREVHLGLKGRWTFVTDDPTVPATGETMSMVTHTGVGRSEDALKAVAHAKDLALKGIAKRLRPIVGPRVPEKDLRVCVEDMDKLVEQQEKYLKGVFEVKYKVTLNREMIEAIKECTALAERLGGDSGAAGDSSAADSAAHGK